MSSGTPRSIAIKKNPDQEENKCNNSTSIPLYIDGKIKMISDINVIEESFLVRFHLYTTWPLSETDAMTYDTLDEREKSQFEPSQIPKLEILHLKYTESDNFTFKSITLKQDAKLKKKYKMIEEINDKCKYICRGKYDFCVQIYESFELESFPFDCQDLSIKLRCNNVKYALKPTIYTQEEKDKDTFFKIEETNVVLTDCQLAGLLCEFYKENGERSRGKKQYSRFTIRVKLKRKINYYFWNFFLINLLLSACAFTVFVFDDNLIDILFGLMFVLIAHKIYGSSYLPKLSYNTILDIYMIGNLIFVVGLFLLCTLVAISDNPDYNQYLFIISTIIWLVGQVAFIIHCINSRNTEIKKLKMGTDELEKAFEIPTKILNVKPKNLKSGIRTKSIYKDLYIYESLDSDDC